MTTCEVFSSPDPTLCEEEGSGGIGQLSLSGSIVTRPFSSQRVGSGDENICEGDLP